MLAACSFTQEALWPSLTGEDPAASKPATTAAPAATAPRPAGMAATNTGVAGAPQPALGTTDFTPPGVTPGESTGTFVGQKVKEIRQELQRLQASVSDHNRQLQSVRAQIVQDSQRYHNAVGSINARLQVGTTPGNPILVQQYNGAQQDLERVSGDVAQLNALVTGVTADSTLAAYLDESSRAAFSISGAVDEDHRQLRILQDEVSQTVVLIDRLLKELTGDINRQTNYVSSERSNLNLLAAGVKSGEIYGASLVNRAMESVAGGSSGQLASAEMKSVDITSRRPLVVIRFDRPEVNYQEAVYNAISQVLERQPAANFDLVAVAPASGGPAKVALNTNKARRHAENVLRSLVQMGLPPSRVAMAGTTSQSADNNEVRIYIR